MIELKNISKYYNNGEVTSVGLRNINLKLSKGEIVAITGESGSGKSTLLNVITRLDNFDDGELYYKGNETSYFSTLDSDDFRKNKVGFIFQNYNVIGSYTVLKNVMLPLILKGKSNKEALIEAKDLIAKVGISHRIKSRASKLSLGETQRLGIARALASDCEILACDEPTGNLDSISASNIINLIKEAAKDKLVLIVTHNFKEVEGIVTRKIKMADGEIIEDLIYSKYNDDENNQKLNLDYVPLKKQICFQVAKENVIYTPKKTLFTGMIFLLFSVFLLLALSFIDLTISSFGSNVDYYNYMPNHLFVYNHKLDVIDPSLLEDNNFDYIINNFSTFKGTNCAINEDYVYLFYTEHVNSYKIIDGRLPNDENEFILVFPRNDSFSIKSFKKHLGYNLSVMDINSNSMELPYKLVGIAINNDGSESVFATGCKKLGNTLDLLNLNLSIQVNNEKLDFDANYLLSSSNLKVRMPKKYKNSNMKVTVQNSYDFDNVVIEYGDYDDVSADIGVFSTNYLKPYFASINSTSPSSDIKKLKELGFDVTYPYNDATANNGFAQTIIKIFIVIMVFFNLWLIIFITFAILSKIYQSKNKDYNILRVLGVTKKDMRWIVIYEVLIIVISSTILSLVLFPFLNKFFFNSVLKLTINNVITLLISMLFLGLILASYFNKRLFKFTVRKSMRALNND